MVIMEADTLDVPIVATDIESTKNMGYFGGYLVENSQDGLLKGMLDFVDGKVKPLNSDYEEYNKKAIDEFLSKYIDGATKNDIIGINAIINTQILTIRYMLPLILGILFSIPIYPKINALLEKKPLINDVLIILLLLLSTWIMLVDSYNPFIYFRF